MKSIQLTDDQIFNVARKIPNGEGRNSYLDQACGDGTDDRKRIDALLAADRANDRFLEKHALEINLTAPDLNGPEISGSEHESPAQQIGPYKLLEVIGEGGMGTVYMAQQTEPVKRKVALKLIKTGMDTRQVIARFEAERQALAIMDHPNIAKVLDAGATESGRPFFVMELVKGKPITEFCDQQKLDTKSRLQLFQSVCNGVQHAHQKGIIHRDLKPSNVLVAMYDDKPVAKVIDFGVAKATGDELTHKTMFTKFDQIIGTLEYMSPEQAQFNNLDIDTRSDVYSLGAILHELLAGEPPFNRDRIKSQALDETLRMIREDEPTRPSTKLSGPAKSKQIASSRNTTPDKLRSTLLGDLDWIVMKALEKDRSRRYETASSLAADIQRYGDNTPVLANPPTSAYRFSKYVQRNKVRIGFAAVLLFVMVAGLVGLGLSNHFLNQKAQETADALQMSDENLRLADQRAKELSNVNEILNFVFGGLDLAQAQDGEISLEQQLAEQLIVASKTLSDANIKDQLVVADAKYNLARLLKNLGSYQEALDLYTESWELRNKELGPTATATLDSRLGIGKALSYLKSKEAIRYLEDTRITFEDTLGQNHVETLECLGFLANAYFNNGDYEKALTIFQVVQKRWPNRVGQENERDELDGELSTLQAIGVCYDYLGQRDKCEAIFLSNAKRSEQSLGKKHPETIRRRATLGGFYQRTSNWNEACIIFEEIFPLAQQHLGRSHPATLDIARRYTRSLRNTGEHLQAIAILREAAMQATIRFGPVDALTLRLVEELSRTLAADGQIEEAIKVRKQLINFLNVDDRPDERSKVKWLISHGEFLITAEQFDDAQHALEKALAMSEQHLNDRPLTIVAIHESLGQCFRKLHSHQEAIQHYEKAFKLISEYYGPDDPKTWEVEANLAVAYWTSKDLEQATEIFSHLLEKYETTFGSENQSTIKLRANLGIVHRDKGETAIARNLLEEVLNATQGNKEFWFATRHLQEVYLELGENDLALRHANKHLERVRNDCAPGSIGLATELEFIGGTIYLKLERFEDAVELLSESLAIRLQETPNQWKVFRNQSALGAALLGENKIEKAEQHLLDGYAGLESAQIADSRPELFDKAIRRLVQFYERRDQLQPDSGFNVEAQKWRDRLAKTLK
jgi:serine/threonine protein kinase